jgi:hypothetical protein
LYIPAMWYHRVSQRTHTVSVNYWYEQRFDFRYVLYSLARRLAEAEGKVEAVKAAALVDAAAQAVEGEAVQAGEGPEVSDAENASAGAVDAEEEGQYVVTYYE